MNELDPRKSRSRGSPEGTRVDEAYLRILFLITDGCLMGGERLPSEDDLATSIGVSRPVIRQALSRLQYGGIVKVRWGAGTFVRDAARAYAIVEPLPDTDHREIDLRSSNSEDVDTGSISASDRTYRS